MKAALLVPLLAACATTAPSPELTFAQSSLERMTDWQPALVGPDSPDEVPPEVDALLAAPLTQTSAVRIALLANREARAVLADVGIARGEFVQAARVRRAEATRRGLRSVAPHRRAHGAEPARVGPGPRPPHG